MKTNLVLILGIIFCGVIACTPIPTATCTDGVHNGDETAIDCGGPTCSACVTCSDGIMNGSETDVDCGGSTCTACDTCVTCAKGGLTPSNVCLADYLYVQADWDATVVSYEDAGYTCQ